MEVSHLKHSINQLKERVVNYAALNMNVAAKTQFSPGSQKLYNQFTLCKSFGIIRIRIVELWQKNVFKKVKAGYTLKISLVQRHKKTGPFATGSRDNERQMFAESWGKFALNCFIKTHCRSSYLCVLSCSLTSDEVRKLYWKGGAEANESTDIVFLSRQVSELETLCGTSVLVLVVALEGKRNRSMTRRQIQDLDKYIITAQGHFLKNHKAEFFFFLLF